MNLPKNYIKVFVAVAVLGCLYYSCGHTSSNKQMETDIPINIIQEANLFVVSKTGAKFFHNYISLDKIKTKHYPPNYQMVYNLFIPDKPFVKSLITFSVDSSSMVIATRDILGIPNCNKNPALCDWQVDKDSALAIAEEQGLAKGIKDWKIAFLWNPERQMYVWRILTTLREFQGDFGYKGSGKEMLINPANGDVLALTGWQIN